MTISCRCPNCGAGFRVDSQLAGRKGRCAKCATSFVIPAPPAQAADAAVAESPQFVASVVEESSPPQSVPLAPAQPTADRAPRGKSKVDRLVTIATLVLCTGALVMIGAIVLPLVHPTKPSEVSDEPPPAGRRAGVTEVSSAANTPAANSTLTLQRWVYDADDHGGSGWFEHQGAGWVEMKQGQLWGRFQETNRTRDYVELYDAQRQVWVRIMPTEANWSKDRATWTLVAHGRATSMPQSLAGAAALNPTFDDWLQDLEAAKRQAAAEQKDILIAFDGSDWCGWSIRLAYEVFFQREFRQQIDRKYVLVFVDFPQKQPALAKVQDADRNTRLAEQFEVGGYPTIVLADAQGRPYSQLGYVEGGVGPFLAKLQTCDAVRRRRDRLFEAIETTQGDDKLAAVKAAVGFLEELDLTRHYAAELTAWLAAVNQLDPHNEKGAAEVAFEPVWVLHVSQAAAADPARASQAVRELDDWRRDHKFHDPDRAARMYLYAAMTWAMAKDMKAAARYIELGVKSEPNDPDLRLRLAGLAGIVQETGTGTGFVVSKEGHILTNHHVIAGANKVTVQLVGRKEPLDAQIVAEDAAHDMALVKIGVPAGVTLVPLALSSEEIHRGMKVGAFGFPLGASAGPGLKLTTGVVSATTDESSNGMMVLDCRVNPGNSGGPLCNGRGCVVGMVSAKSLSSRAVDSYGMALPADALQKFLAAHLPAAQLTKAAAGPESDWEGVDRIVAPSVVMITAAK